MTTATEPHARDAGGIFLETPPAIRDVCRKLLEAQRASVASAGKRYPEEISYAEMMQVSRDRFESEQEVERVVGDHQGASLLSGLYRVDGWLVGFRKINKRGLSLVVYPERK